MEYVGLAMGRLIRFAEQQPRWDTKTPAEWRKLLKAARGLGY